jgi:hypothetical protein
MAPRARARWTAVLGPSAQYSRFTRTRRSRPWKRSCCPALSTAYLHTSARRGWMADSESSALLCRPRRGAVLEFTHRSHRRCPQVARARYSKWGRIQWGVGRPYRPHLAPLAPRLASGSGGGRCPTLRWTHFMVKTHNAREWRPLDDVAGLLLLRTCGHARRKRTGWHRASYLPGATRM